MKRFFSSVLLLGSLVPFTSSAAVFVELDKDVEALVVNGEELPITIVGHRSFDLEDGNNQIVVRVSKLVQKGSEFEKFKSDPIVVTFNTADKDILLSPSQTITKLNDAKKFDEKPSFSLEDKNGTKISSQQAVLPRGPGMIRDYEREVAKFNYKQGIAVAPNTYAASLAAGEQYVQPEPVAVQPAKQASAPLSNEQSLILLQADFIRLSAEEQKKFLQWAVENVRS
ncbi:DUF2057 domain-containing protein [Grimontia kaedaensis]|uniref:DUF2057 domain-containing protein n=1 Tax=Grimontia kaedaensis TaxID=2872157 RepID=A0ABY4WWS4_9GAMM|nr:DUF2057 domain-containing protein [Grimontia kaedaensis]USH03150.1 DUF2057 domain-containing protein [Grimontia kaedaensis]